MESIRERQRKFEALIHKTEGRIEALKTEYNLFFAGEVNIPPEKERVNIEKNHKGYTIKRSPIRKTRFPSPEFVFKILSL